MATDGVQSVSLNYYVHVLRQRLWVVILCALLGAVAALGALALVPARATATAAVSADVISADPFNPSRSASGLIDPAGEALIAESFTVAQRAASRLGGSYTAQDVRERTDVTVVPDTTVLRISASAASDEQAREVADAVALEYLSHRSEQAQERIDRTLERASTRLASLREDLAEVDAVLLEADDNSLERAQAETDRSMLTLEINSVLAEVASTQNIDTTGGSVLSPAATNPVDYYPPRVPVLLTGTLAGLGLGVLMAFVLNAFNNTVHGAREVAESGGRRVLGELRERRATLPATGPDLESFRALRERILSDQSMAERTGVLAVLDETPGGGGDDVAANLSAVLASSGVAVEYLRLDASDQDLQSLVDALALREQADDARGRRFESVVVPHFTVYVPPAEDAGIVDEPLSRTVRQELSERRRDVLVVLHAPPGVSPATRLAVGRVADSVILVAAERKTRTSSLLRATQDMRAMGTPVLGTVLISAHRHGSRTANASSPAPRPNDTPAEPALRTSEARVTSPAGSKGNPPARG